MVDTSWMPERVRPFTKKFKEKTKGIEIDLVYNGESLNASMKTLHQKVKEYAKTNGISFENAKRTLAKWVYDPTELAKLKE